MFRECGDASVGQAHADEHSSNFRHKPLGAPYGHEQRDHDGQETRQMRERRRGGQGPNQTDEAQRSLMHVGIVHRPENRRLPFERAGRTVIKGPPKLCFMARPSKAHRPKRRWIGVELGPHYVERGQVEAKVAEMFSVKVRLMDVLPAQERNGKFGVAILGVTLAVAPAVRDVLADDQVWAEHGMRSVTTSGKIRLVRERLELPRPPRR